MPGLGEREQLRSRHAPGGRHVALDPARARPLHGEHQHALPRHSSGVRQWRLAHVNAAHASVPRTSPALASSGVAPGAGTLRGRRPLRVARGGARGRGAAAAAAAPGGWRRRSSSLAAPPRARGARAAASPPPRGRAPGGGPVWTGMERPSPRAESAPPRPRRGVAPQESLPQLRRRYREGSPRPAPP